MDQVPAPVVDERLAQTIVEQDVVEQNTVEQDVVEQNTVKQTTVKHTAVEQTVETAINLLCRTKPPVNTADLDKSLVNYTDVLNQVDQLNERAKVALICKLITHLENEHIQTILEFGQQEIAARQHHAVTSKSTVNRATRLVLKKDYSYQERGLSEPTQYYVYLRRRKPKLDRYIGTLFYIPQGCTLSYFPDSEGRIIFNPPHHVFQLRDSNQPSVVQIVRLVCLEPPPAHYTFTKQQDDSPEIYLRLEYLDPKTYCVIAEKVYSFPFCMYEGGALDRYRWNVSTIALPDSPVTSQPSIDQPSADQPSADQPSADQRTNRRGTASPAPSPSLPSSSDPLQDKALSDRDFASSNPSRKATPDQLPTSKRNIDQPIEQPKSSQSDGNQLGSRQSKSNPPESIQSKSSQSKSGQPKSDRSKRATPKASRRVIELPTTPLATFYLTDRRQIAHVLERMQLWVTWSEKAMPQSRWEIVQEKTVFILMNANFKRNILIFSSDQASLTLANSLPVLMKWFHDLSLAVSQSRNQQQYSASQLKLAHGLFVDMSLPHDDPLAVLNLLFDIEFSKTSS